MRNVDYKAELRDPALARGCLRAMGAMHIITVQQRDTHFRLPDGRLLRRESDGEPTEWIFYHRADLPRPRISTFTILTDEQARARWGAIGLREWLVIEKQRDLWMTKHVAIALDEVTDLGRFIEITAMLAVESDVRDCHERIADLREAFDPALGESIASSYPELLARERDRDPAPDLDPDSLALF